MKKIALLPEGTTSHEAVINLLSPDPFQLCHYQMIADVFLSTVNKKTNFSLIPIENTIDGSVSLHMDWLVHEVNLPIQAEFVYPSRQHLIGRFDQDLAQVTHVYSHPVAMAQCNQFLRKYLPHATCVNMSSTAEAVQKVKEHKEENWVAIGTELGAKFYDLYILKHSVMDHTNNATRFLILGTENFPLSYPFEMKTSLAITIPEDYAGALHQVLSTFAWRKLNLTRIESRPTKKKLGSYYFCIDVQSKSSSLLFQSAIMELEALGCQVRTLGSYPSYIRDKER